MMMSGVLMQYFGLRIWGSTSSFEIGFWGVDENFFLRKIFFLCFCFTIRIRFPMSPTPSFFHPNYSPPTKKFTEGSFFKVKIWPIFSPTLIFWLFLTKNSPSLNFKLFEVQSGTQKYHFFAFLPLKPPKNFRAFGAILNFFQIFSQFFSNSYLFPKISGIFIPMS